MKTAAWVWLMETWTVWMSQGQYLGGIQSCYWKEGAEEFTQNQLSEVFDLRQMYFISLPTEEGIIYTETNISVQWRPKDR